VNLKTSAYACTRLNTVPFRSFPHPQTYSRLRSKTHGPDFRRPRLFTTIRYSYVKACVSTVSQRVNPHRRYISARSHAQLSPGRFIYLTRQWDMEHWVSRKRVVISPDRELCNVPFTELAFQLGLSVAVSIAQCFTTFKLRREVRCCNSVADIPPPSVLMVATPTSARSTSPFRRRSANVANWVGVRNGKCSQCGVQSYLQCKQQKRHC
jgi:hypothetical protein